MSRKYKNRKKGYKVGDNGSDIVYKLDNDIQITHATFKLQTFFQPDGGEGPIAVGEPTKTGSTATWEIFLWAGGIVISEALSAELAIRLASFSASLRNLTMPTIPSFWLGKLNKHLEFIGVSDSSITITYDTGEQKGLNG